MYGYFQCPKCESKWESAHVYPRSNGSSEYFKQECQTCRIKCSPYRVEPTICSICGVEARHCGCDKSRKNDPNKPHMADLCEKCQSGDPC